jgi:acyl-CoA thioesterase-2
MAARDTEPIRIARGTTVSNDLQQLLDNLHVEQIDTNLFRGFTLPSRNPRIYGGQVLAQAMNAATRSVDPARHVHSQHAYFLRPGDPARAVIYEVDPIRDGRGFSTRRVVARQGGRAIFNTAISYQQPEDGLAHHEPMPEVPPPESLESDFSYHTRMAAENPSRYHAPSTESIDYRPLEQLDRCDPPARPPRFGVWMRANGTMPDTPGAHAQMLAYMSDCYLMSTALLPHGISYDNPAIQTASLDHGLWFYEDFRADQWLYYHLVSPLAGRARGFNIGYVYTREGRLVAAAVQEGLMRQVAPPG